MILNVYRKPEKPPQTLGEAERANESYEVTHYEFTGNVIVMYDVTQRWYSAPMGAWVGNPDKRKRVIAISLLPGDRVEIS